jgi:hypothetical protein
MLEAQAARGLGGLDARRINVAEVPVDVAEHPGFELDSRKVAYSQQIAAEGRHGRPVRVPTRVPGRAR